MQVRNVMKRMRQRYGLPATIARGNQTCAPTVTLARNSNQAIEQQNFTVEADQQDVMVAAADYAPGGTPSAPQMDDQITVTIGTASRVFRVIVPNGSEKCFRELDPEGTELRVHTKRF